MEGVSNWKYHLPSWIHTPVCWLAAVLVATLLNLMDSATYGRIFFPIHLPLFSPFESLGIGMYLLCTATSQLIITLGSSFRKGATACAMIENIPFYHSICLAVATRLLDDSDRMMATILMAYLSSSLLVASIFLILALWKVDRLVHKFPRVVLVGLMGGIGLFLWKTGLDMAANQTLTMNNAWQLLFASPITATLWMVGMTAAFITLVAELKGGWRLVTPLMSLSLIASFYIIYWVQPYDLDQLRDLGWLLRGPTSKTSPGAIFHYFKLDQVDWYALLTVLPTIIGSALFGALHVPINCPSFARLSNQNFSMKQELFTQAISNMTTSVMGFFPNYFVYTNSILFLRSGATHRIAGILLAISTGLVLFYGLNSLDYIPVVIPLFLIFYLAFCLLHDAIVASTAICTTTEYLQLLIIMIFSQVFGFIYGLLVGMGMAIINAAIVFRQLTGRASPFEEERQIVGNPVVEKFINKFLQQCLILQYEGYLYFGSCVEELGKLSYYRIDHESMVIDFGQVYAMDLNFKEGFLAMLQTLGRREDERRTRVICLNVPEPRLVKMLQRDNQVVVGEGSPQQWLKERLQGSARSTEEHDENVLLLLLETPDDILNPEQCRELSDHQMKLAGILTALRGKEGTTRMILFHRGEPVASQLEEEGSGWEKGILVILKGRLRRRTIVYGTGAWVGLEEALNEEEGGLPGCLAVTATTAIYIRYTALMQGLPDVDYSFLRYLVTDFTVISAHT